MQCETAHAPTANLRGREVAVVDDGEPEQVLRTRGAAVELGPHERTLRHDRSILRARVRTVLCYGDSNTWGFDPETQGRFPRDVRWPGRLQATLGDEWHVVEEGLNGRTTTLDSPLNPGRNGLDYLLPCLESHAPLDAVVIFLGTNDLAERYSLTATDIPRAAARLASVVAHTETGIDGAAPLPILACPPPVGDTEWSEDWAGASAKSAVLAKRFAAVAGELGFEWIDLSDATRYSPLDGIHLDAAGHAAVAGLVARTLRRLFP
jgi:lysophospholipase L1-like esterase